MWRHRMFSDQRRPRDPMCFQFDRHEWRCILMIFNLNWYQFKKWGVDRRVLRHCRNPGLNQGPLDLQSNALPTELFRPTRERGPAHHQYRIQVVNDMSDCTPKHHEVRPSQKCVSIGGSVVECSPATRAARVRFPDDANIFFHFLHLGIWTIFLFPLLTYLQNICHILWSITWLLAHPKYQQYRGLC